MFRKVLHVKWFSTAMWCAETGPCGLLWNGLSMEQAPPEDRNVHLLSHKSLLVDPKGKCSCLQEYSWQSGLGAAKCFGEGHMDSGSGI